MTAVTIAILTACVVLTAMLIYKKQKVLDLYHRDCYVFVGQSRPMAIFGVLMWLEYAYLSLKLADSDYSVFTTAFKWNIIVFMLAAAGLGVYVFLYCFLKGFYAFDDKLTAVSSFGRVFEFRWKDVVSVKTVQFQNLRFKLKDGREISIGGKTNDMLLFADFAMNRLPKSVDCTALKRIKVRMDKNKHTNINKRIMQGKRK